MGKENQRPPASRFLFIVTPLFPHCTPLSACVLCVLVGLYPSRLLRLDVFTTLMLPIFTVSITANYRCMVGVQLYNKFYGRLISIY